MNPQVAYLLLIVATLVVLGATAGYAWRHRRAPGGMAFTLFVGAALAWAFLIGAMAVTDPAMARVLLSFKFLAIGVATTASFMFIAQRTGHLTHLSRLQSASFMVIPLLGHIASFSDHAGMIRSTQFGSAHGLTHIAAVSFGPIYWLFTGYAYTLIISSIAFLVLARKEGGALEQARATPLLFGVIAPLLTNILLITGIAPRAFDPMPFGIAVSAVCLWWGAFHGRVLDLIPVARRVLVDALPDGILIVDSAARILDMNASFAEVARVTPTQLVGRTIMECTLPAPGMREALRSALDSARAPVPATDQGSPTVPPPLILGERAFDIRVIPVIERETSTAARIVVLHDVTARHRWESEQVQLITQLRDALGQVRTLTGLLPICSDCKRIRDGAGDWQRLEVFIRDRTDADFSHAMCPSCVERWYPEFAEEKNDAR